MRYSKKRFLQDVKDEATALRDNAFKTEKNRLNFDTLQPSDRSYCVYGQMTGSCESRRATTLIHKCCKRYVKNNDINLESLGGVLKSLNGGSIPGINTAENLFENRQRHFLYHLSSIEAYILTKEGNNKGLIDYIKGEIKDVKL